MAESTATKTESLRWVLFRSGLGSEVEIRRAMAQGAVSVDGRTAGPEAVARAGPVTVRGYDYTIDRAPRSGRLMVARCASSLDRIPGTRRLYCGLHKCLTMYTRKVFVRACRLPLGSRRSFRHFFHRDDVFYRECADYDLASISGHALDLDRFEDVRVVRIVRDPRDLLVSGYFYHKRGAEGWCHARDPSDLDWIIVDGAIPAALPDGASLKEHLERVPIEDGLRMEMDFRQRHYDGLLGWPEADPRVKLFRYEDIVGGEVAAFEEILDFLELPWAGRRVGRWAAGRYAASRRAGRDPHIRDPSDQQWRRYFDDDLTEAFAERYGAVLERYGYPLR